jgi:hypothetical protein
MVLGFIFGSVLVSFGVWNFFDRFCDMSEPEYEMAYVSRYGYGAEKTPPVTPPPSPAY